MIGSEDGEVLELELGERGPARIDRRVIVVVVVHQRRPAGWRAGGGARGGKGEFEQDRISDELLEVDLVTEQGVGLAVDGVRHEELPSDRDVEVGRDLAQADAAGTGPMGTDHAPGDDTVGHSFEHEIELHGLLDARGSPTEVLDSGFAVKRPA